MSKKIPLYLSLILIVLAALITFNATYLFFNEKYNRKLNQTLERYSYFDELLGIDSVVRKNYIGEIDEDALKATVMRGYLSGIGDAYSAYMTSEEYDAFLKEQSGSSVGIGVNVINDSEDGALEIINVFPDSPAEKAGIASGDLIIGVGDVSVSEIGYYKAIELIKGQSGTTVELKILHGEEEKTVVCQRGEIIAPNVTYHVFASDSTVGVIKLEEFISTTPGQLKDAVEKLLSDGCDKFVFDLRNNPGGDLNSIVKVLDYLLPQGPITHIYYNDGKESHFTSDEQHVDGKFAVLTNGNTASAAELFTSALKDYAAHGDIDAVIVGTKTYGKGVLQTFYQLKSGAAFKISTGRYDPPYSENYNEKGITPDYEVELSEEAAAMNFYKLTDETDNQLIEAVAILNK